MLRRRLGIDVHHVRPFVGCERLARAPALVLAVDATAVAELASARGLSGPALGEAMVVHGALALAAER